MATNTQSTFGGLTLDGDTHVLVGLSVVALRVLIGGMILFAGIGKYADGPFDAAGYLANIDPASPVSGLYGAMATVPALMDVVNVIVPLTQVLIGIALITGGFVRLAAVGGAIQMLAFYLGGWPLADGVLAAFGSTLIYAAVFVTVAALGAGRYAGADRYIERIEVGGEPLIERVPAFRYLLG